MIFTSYYANLKNIPQNLKPISISLYKPKDIDIDSIIELAPSKEILSTYKNSKQTNIDRDKYIKDYKNQIKNYDFSKLDNVVLMCYENPFDFCHRHIVAEMIEIQTGNKISEYGFDNEKLDYRLKDNKKRVAIIGSRTFNNKSLAEYILNKYLNGTEIIVSGGAIGADSIAEEYAIKNKMKTDIYLPDWTIGKHAGFLRNKKIIDAADEVIAFTNGSRGTANSISIAKEQGKKVKIISFKENNNFKISFEKRFSIDLCNKNPDKIFVFGDNLIGKGKGGQAIIRDCPNAFGIPTKRLPSMDENSFFSDKEDEEKIVLSRLRELYKLMFSGKEIILPIDGLGTGLADMENKSPKIFKKMNETIKNHFLNMIEEVEIWY